MAQRSTRVRSVCLAAVLAGLCVVVVGCGTPRPSRVGCRGVDDEVLRVLETRLQAESKLRNGRLVEGEGELAFVSAELVRAEDDEDDSGDVLTFAISGTGGEYRAVDARAREESTWSEASFDVREDGAIESRACVAPMRGVTEEELARCANVPAQFREQCEQRNR